MTKAVSYSISEYGELHDKVRDLEVAADCLKRFNDPVLVGLSVERLIGYAEDEYDCYLVLRRADGERYWHTCVGGYTFLDALKIVDVVQGKGWNALTRLDTNLTCARCPQEKTFKVWIEN